MKLGPGKRVLVAAFGETPLEAIDSHTRLEVTEPPDPGALRPDEVIVAIKSAQVGWVDLLMTSGQYQHLPSPPYVPGMEYAGVVVARSDGVDVGGEVVVDPFVAGPRSLGAYQSAGGFATYAVVPAAALRPLPRGMTLDQGACLFGSYETAYHCLVARGELRAGETVLIHGASGATGLAAVQIAKILGATVIATGRSKEKLEIVARHGADHVIDIRGEDGGLRSFKDEVKRLTHGRGVEVVYDGVGGEVSIESLRCVVFGARFLIVGWASTPFVAKGKGGRGAPNANVLPTNLILMKGLDVRGCPTAIATAMDPTIRSERVNRVLEWAEEGRIAPHVSHVFPLERYRDAMHAKWRGDVIGGCVLRPAE